MVHDPIDLSKIMLKFHGGSYPGLFHFSEDMNLMFDNYKKFFKDSDVEVLTYTRTYHSHSLFVECKLLKFPLIRSLQIGKFMFCAAHKPLPAPIRDFFQLGSDVHSHHAKCIEYLLIQWLEVCIQHLNTEESRLLGNGCCSKCDLLLQKGYA